MQIKKLGLCSALSGVGVALFLFFGSTYAHAHPITELLKLTARAAARTTSGAALSTEARMTRLISDRAFRKSVLAELERTGNHALAEKLSLAWVRAETPLYQQMITQQLHVTQAIRTVGFRFPDKVVLSVQDDTVSMTSNLVTNSLDDVPFSAFASRSTLQSELTKAVAARASTAAKSAESKFSFEVTSGKLSVPFKTDALGMEIKFGEVNLYKVAAATAGLLVCGGIDCVETAAKDLLNAYANGAKGETPAQTNERLRRLGRDAAMADDPLNKFVAAVAQSSATSP